MVYQCKDVADFNSKLTEAGGKLVVVDFYATWCGPCKVIGPKLEAMSQSMSDVVFVKVDVDENDELTAQYGISAMPTFVFIKNGEKVDSFAGANEAKLREMIEKNK